MKAFILILGMLTTANAHCMSGKDLHYLLTSPNVAEKSQGLSYIKALLDAQDVISAKWEESQVTRKPSYLSFRACVPQSVPVEHAADIVKVYLDQIFIVNDMGDWNAFSLSQADISENWPCGD